MKTVKTNMEYSMHGTLTNVPIKLIPLIRWRIYNKRGIIADTIKLIAEGKVISE